MTDSSQHTVLSAPIFDDLLTKIDNFCIEATNLIDSFKIFLLDLQKKTSFATTFIASLKILLLEYKTSFATTFIASLKILLLEYKTRTSSVMCHHNTHFAHFQNSIYTLLGKALLDIGNPDHFFPEELIFPFIDFCNNLKFLLLDFHTSLQKSMVSASEAFRENFGTSPGSVSRKRRRPETPSFKKKRSVAFRTSTGEDELSSGFSFCFAPTSNIPGSPPHYLRMVVSGNASTMSVGTRVAPPNQKLLHAKAKLSV